MRYQIHRLNATTNEWFDTFVRANTFAQANVTTEVLQEDGEVYAIWDTEDLQWV